MNKKFYKILSIVTFSTLLLVGCGKEETVSTQSSQETEQTTNESEVVETSQTEVKENTENKGSELVNVNFEEITFKIPNTAEKLDVGEQQLPVAVYLLDATIGTSFNVVLEPLQQPLSLKEYIDLATASTGYEYQSNEYYTTNGIEWNEVVSLNNTPQGTMKLNQRTFMKDDQVYIFTYAGTPENYESNLQDFKNVIESVIVN